MALGSIGSGDFGTNNFSSSGSNSDGDSESFGSFNRIFSDAIGSQFETGVNAIRLAGDSSSLTTRFGSGVPGIFSGLGSGNRAIGLGDLGFGAGLGGVANSPIDTGGLLVDSQAQLQLANIQRILQEQQSAFLGQGGTLDPNQVRPLLTQSLIDGLVLIRQFDQINPNNPLEVVQLLRRFRQLVDDLKTSTLQNGNRIALDNLLSFLSNANADTPAYGIIESALLEIAEAEEFIEFEQPLYVVEGDDSLSLDEIKERLLTGLSELPNGLPSSFS